MFERSCRCGAPAANAKGVPRCSDCKLEGRRAYAREYKRREWQREALRKGRPQPGDTVIAQCRWCTNEFSFVSLGRPRFKCDACKKRSGAALVARWAKQHPDRIREHKRRYNASTQGQTATKAYNREARFAKYGSDRAWYEAQLQAQDGRCAICRADSPGGKTNAWHIDHDRSCCGAQGSCGKCLRGILCAKCNLGVGQFDDDPDRLLAAAAYVLQWVDAPSVNSRPARWDARWS
jgi:hypothetical protein